jgi:hypothetical protein
MYRETSPWSLLIDVAMVGFAYFGGRSDGKKAAYAEIHEDKQKKEMDELRAEIERLKATR